MTINIAPTNGVSRKVNIIEYKLTKMYINIRYEIIMTYREKEVVVEDIPIFLQGEDFDYYKHLEINEMLNKILNNYL